MMIKRLIIYVLGVLILGFGIVLNTKTGLGVAAINSVPYALSQMTSLTLGNWTPILYCVFIICELIIYKKIDIKVILQFPFSYVMGMILDFYNTYITFVPAHMGQSFLLLCIAIILTALGAYLVVSMDLVPNPADGMVNALSYLSHQEFGQVKWIFDCLMMSLTILMTWIMTHHVIGIGIGTIISALCVGRCIQFYQRMMGKYVKEIVTRS